MTLAETLEEIAPATSKPLPRAAEAPATLQVRLRSMSWEAPGVLSLELTAADGSSLPPFEPGCHIDLHLPSGTMRQYSLCGDPADLSHYRVAIRAVSGGLSSQFVHRKLRPGELLTVSLPRNNFPLADAEPIPLYCRRHRHYAAPADDAGRDRKAKAVDAALLQPA